MKHYINAILTGAVLLVWVWAMVSMLFVSSC